MFRIISRVWLALALALPAIVRAEAPATAFTLMSFNTWHAGGHIEDGVRKGIEAIRQSGADVVGLQESSAEVAGEIAAALGWQRADGGNGSAQIISRLPILGSLRAGPAIGARVRLADDPPQDAVIFNCHLDYRFYGPYVAAAGGTAADVLREEARSDRAAQIAEILAGMAPQLAAADAAPVFLTGDFNCPSHLDWTAATAPSHGGAGPVAWPVSTRLAAAGLADAFRAVHPDPLADPGTTWSAVHKAPEPQDRIDFIHWKGATARVLDCRTFTLAVETTLGKWGEALEPVRANTWPSDHAAVLARFELRAAPQGR